MKKIKNKIKRREPILRSVIRDLEYFTPAAAVIGLFIGYPMIYYISKALAQNGWHYYLAGGTAEICAFGVFLIIINFYRYGIRKIFKKTFG